MPATILTDRAMLDGNPEAGTESNSQRATPQCAKFGDQTHLRGVLKIFELFCGLEDPQALACSHVTRHGESGQRTGGLHLAQNAAGARL